MSKLTFDLSASERQLVVLAREKHQGLARNAQELRRQAEEVEGEALVAMHEALDAIQGDVMRRSGIEPGKVQDVTWSPNGKSLEFVLKPDPPAVPETPAALTVLEGGKS